MTEEGNTMNALQYCKENDPLWKNTLFLSRYYYGNFAEQRMEFLERYKAAKTEEEKDEIFDHYINAGKNLPKGNE